METNRLQILFEKKPCYDIVYEKSFDKLAEELTTLGTGAKRFCIITDSHVKELYGDEVLKALSACSEKVVLFPSRQVRRVKILIR